MTICMIAGDNPHYVHSLVEALGQVGLRIDLVGGDPNEKLVYSPFVTFINLRGSQDPKASVPAKAMRVGRYYFRCIHYMLGTHVKVVHIQAYRFNLVEGIILVSLYRMLGKKVVYTAHNVQPKGKNNKLNNFMFYFIYRIVDHVICHTEKMKSALVARYRIRGEKVSVVEHGLNFSIPITQFSQSEARRRIGIDPQAKVLLLFGRIRPYKGYEIAFEALKYLGLPGEQPLLLVVGEAIKKDRQYLEMLKEQTGKEGLRSTVQFYDKHVADDEVEYFFEATDALLLPYREGDFQSGVLFLAYRFGLPVIASDVGSFAEEIENGARGYVFRSGDASDLAAKIGKFYNELKGQPDLRQNIRQYAKEKYSWDCISRKTLEVYERMV